MKNGVIDAIDTHSDILKTSDFSDELTLSDTNGNSTQGKREAEFMQKNTWK